MWLNKLIPAFRFHIGRDGTVAMSSANGLVGTGFVSRYNLNITSCYRNNRKEGNVLFNEALNTFLICLCGLEHMVMGHSYTKRGNLMLPLHWLLFLINSKGSFICTIKQTGEHIPQPLLHQSWSIGCNE